MLIVELLWIQVVGSIILIQLPHSHAIETIFYNDLNSNSIGQEQWPWHRHLGTCTDVCCLYAMERNYCRGLSFSDTSTRPWSSRSQVRNTVNSCCSQLIASLSQQLQSSCYCSLQLLMMLWYGNHMQVMTMAMLAVPIASLDQYSSNSATHELRRHAIIQPHDPCIGPETAGHQISSEHSRQRYMHCAITVHVMWAAHMDLAKHQTHV